MIRELIRRIKVRRLRQILRGHRTLKKTNSLGRVNAVKEALTTMELLKSGSYSRVIFGAGQRNAELIIRQYLLIRVGGLNLNKALLLAIGKPDSAVVHPLPPQWLEVVEQHGFKVAKIRSVLAWNGFVTLFFAYGMVLIGRQLFASIREIIRPQYESLGRYGYFDTLSAGNLPQPCKNGRSYEIVTWYQKWLGRVSELDTLCHGVKGVASSTVDGVPVVSVPLAIPPLTKIKALVRFVGWGVAASAIGLIDLVRGRWWHAVILGEAANAAQARLQDSTKLARDYLFHNSGFIYRPLWTYEAEKRGSRITFYFYSTNCEPFNRPDGYPKILYGWQAMSWPQYLVWDEYQADFVRRAVGESANISVVGPIWFHTSGNEMRELPRKAVAVFDVQPMRGSFYQTLGIDFDYYTPKIANQFLSDIHETLSECGGTLILKQKRKIGKLAHPKYRQFVEKFNGRSNFFAVDPDTSALRLIEDSVAVISMPFTSTALLGRWLGKPSVYYDPSGLIQKGDRAAHGIEILCGVEKLHEWMASVMKLGLDE